MENYELYRLFYRTSRWYKSCARLAKSGETMDEIEKLYGLPEPYKDGCSMEENSIFWSGAAYELENVANMFKTRF